MSAEFYPRRLLLENNPALRAQVEKVVTVSDCSENDAAEPNNGDMQHADWPQPQPLGGELPAVQGFDVVLLPGSLRPLVTDTADRMQVPLDFPAVISVLCLAGAVNRRATIQPKASDTSWTVVPNLWGGIIAPPGLMKSPVISVVTQPLTRIEASWRAEYESAKSAYEHEKEELELRRAAWREQYKAACKKSGKDASLRPDDSIAEPVCRRLLTQDATSEKLHEILRDNPAGVVVIRDELSACSPRWISLDVKVNVGSFSLRGMATPVIPLIGSGVALSMLTPVVCRC